MNKYNNSKNKYNINLKNKYKDSSQNKQNKHYNIKCGNCGIKGHIYSNCRLPKLSYGIILFNDLLIDNKFTNNILLIQRKDSLTYIEFIRGKYNINDKSYLQTMFNRMTKIEHENILNKDLLDLWNDLWLLDKYSIPKKFLNEYKYSKILFDKLKKGFYIKCPNINGSIINVNNHNLGQEPEPGKDEEEEPEPENFNVEKSNIFICIKYFITNISYVYITPEWGFPKGRRNYDESDIDASIREFEEETNIKKENIKLLKNLYPFSEEFYGSNNIKYKHIYYLAKNTVPDIKLYIDKNNKEQITEIGNIKWFNKTDALKIFRSYEINKLELINHIFKFIDNYKNFCGEY